MLKLHLQFFGGRGAEAINFGGGTPEGKLQPNNSPMELVPESLKEALGDKGKGKSMSDAIENSNPRYNKYYGEYSKNCQRAIVAAELRRRGYNVEAQPTYAGDKWPEEVWGTDGDFHERWRGAFRHAQTDKVGVNGNTARAQQRTPNNLTKKMKEYGNGARAVVKVLWKNKGTGHVFTAENRNGNIVFLRHTNRHKIPCLRYVQHDEEHSNRGNNPYKSQ